MIRIFERAGAFVFDGAGRWVLVLGGVAALIGGFWLKDNRLERLARETERGNVINEVKEQTDATIANIKSGAARAAGAAGRPAAGGVLDPTTRD
jgi:hypothetical protein